MNATNVRQKTIACATLGRLAKARLRKTKKWDKW